MAWFDNVDVRDKVGIGINRPPTVELEVNGTVIAGKFVGDGSGLTKAGQWADVESGISYNEGNVGIGTTIPSAELEVNGDIKGSADLVISGNVGIGTTGPKAKLNVVGDVIIEGNLGVRGLLPELRPTWSGIHTWDIEAEGTIFSEHGIVGGKATTTTGWALGRGAWGPDNWLRLTTKHGGDTYHDLAVNHLWATDARRFDLAEVTPVKVEDQLEQGDVVVIDEEDGLRVKRSTKSYDTLVYGIVSSYESAAMVIGGAGPEVVMRESGKLPIALIGRVKAKVSAEAGAIQVGDLLTTSSTPGHLMKCSDISKSTGTVVGKALEPFKGDKGMITILVTLQ